MEQVRKILLKHFPADSWTIKKSPAGLSKESYVAESGDKKIFFKFDVRTPALSRLAEISVTPPILATGKIEKRPYIIQKFVDGYYPDRTWFANNIVSLAQFIKKYQSDEKLRQILSGNKLESYEEHIDREIRRSEVDLTGANSAIFDTKPFHEAFSLLKEQASRLTHTPLVPVHADPNYKNILVTDEGITMIDWDDIVLSDSMRDVGLILWWYLAQSSWKEFFIAFGEKMDRDKIFWWVAKRSLAIALWFDKRKVEKEAKAYINDFYLAMLRKDNPQVIAPISV